MVPLFKVMRELGLLNTYLALILPYTVLSMPVCTLVMASFFQDIPPDLEAAAMVDGCSRVGALFHVVIPLSAPGVFTAAILAFVNAWDEFLLALTLMNRVSMRTLSVSVTLTRRACIQWRSSRRRSVIAIVPICIIIAVFRDASSADDERRGRLTLAPKLNTGDHRLRRFGLRCHEFPEDPQQQCGPYYIAGALPTPCRERTTERQAHSDRAQRVADHRQPRQQARARAEAFEPAKCSRMRGIIVCDTLVDALGAITHPPGQRAAQRVAGGADQNRRPEQLRVQLDESEDGRLGAHGQQRRRDERHDEYS
jgi:hypothetical protein